MRGRVLGIDPGSRRVGVAVSDTARRVATPLEVVERSRTGVGYRREIGRLADEWEVTLIVVGLPLSLDGTMGPAARAARDEAAALADVTGLPVETYDERFTTVTAEQALIDQNLDTTRRREIVDKVAASVLLQSWLDAQPADRPRPTDDA